MRLAALIALPLVIAVPPPFAHPPPRPPAPRPPVAPAPPAAAAPDAPATVLDRELAAHNAHDLDALLSVYAPDAELYEFPDKLLARGKDALRQHFEQRFADPKQRADLVSRLAIGDKIIDREVVARTLPGGPGTADLVAISEVKRGLISRRWFIFGEERLDERR